MKKSTIFYALGTLILAVGGLMVTKANKRTQYNKAVPRGLSGITVNHHGHFTTFPGLGARTCGFVTTNSGTQNFHTMLAVTPTGNRQAYYK